MSSVVVDADVVSFVFKNHPIGRQYDAGLADRTLIVSFMTLAELGRWTVQSKWSEARRNWLRLYLESFVLMPYNRALARNGLRLPSPRRQADIGLNARTPGSQPRRSSTTCPSLPTTEAIIGECRASCRSRIADRGIAHPQIAPPPEHFHRPRRYPYRAC
jgi:hypothetical protein